MQQGKQKKRSCNMWRARIALKKQPQKKRRRADRAWEADVVSNSRQKDLSGLKLSVGAMHRHLLLQKGVECVGSNQSLIERAGSYTLGVPFKCTKIITSALEYLVAEIMELSSHCAEGADTFMTEVKHIEDAVSTGEELEDRCRPIETDRPASAF